MQSSHDIGYLLGHVASVLHRQSDQVLQERLGIGLSQYKILSMLQESASVSQREIADSLGQTEASVSRQVKLLQEKGMLASGIDPSERRKHLTRPTAKGLKILQAAQDTLGDYYAPMLAEYTTKEQEQFLRMLNKAHEYSCAPGKPMACDRLTGIEGVYEAQQ